ncbi:MAG: ABC transporter ATP-binding protein [Oscillospiraceae bacterium]
MIKKFISYFRPHLKLFTLDMTCAFIVALCDLFFPMIAGNIIDVYVPNRQIRLLLIWSVTLLLIFIFKAVLNYIILYYGHCVGVKMQSDMRRDIFKHMQKLPFTFFDSNKTGSIMSRIINDLMEVSELAHHGPEDLFVSTIMLVGSFIILCTINVPLTLIIFAFIPFLIFFASKTQLRMGKAFKKTREEVSEINASLENSISGIRVAKAFTNSNHEETKFAKNNVSFEKAREFAYKTMAEFYCGMWFLTDFLNLVVLVAGGIFCYYGKITFGEFVKYLLYINLFLTPIKKIIGFIEQYQNGMSGFKRFIEILEAEPEPESPNAIDVKSVNGTIKFNNVSFAYGQGKEILSGINLEIPQGKTVAFVGPSGGGKTTLCHLIPRFYDICEGDIRIDGINIQNFTYESLRQNIGIVQQDVFLFTGTIWDNIAYGKIDASDEEILEAAKLANIHEFVMELPDKYETNIGERGVKLSGGQKQRLSIARLFLKNPPILILDESTSALDNATELLIQEALDKLSEGKTSLIVAHRLSTIKNADTIVVLTEKGIVEQGSHKDLLSHAGLYKELYESQFKLNNE